MYNHCLGNREHVPVSIELIRKISESLGEPEMLWEQEPLGECFHSFSSSPKFS